METSTNGTTWTAATNTQNQLTTNAGNTSSTKVRIVSKPSIKSWMQDIGKSYENNLKMYEEYNSHMIKNSEFGAVSYLTESIYGRNGNEVGINESIPAYTGAGPKSGTDVTGGTYTFNANDYAWNTTQGQKSSTTGNIYGVYDMAGGNHEFTATYLEGGKITGSKTNI